MKIVLINPNRRFHRSNIWKVINSVTPPLGLGLLCSLLEGVGFDPLLIDAYALEMSEQDVLEAIPPDTSLVGITSTTVEISDAVSLSRAIKKKLPEVEVVMGGVHPTLFHEEMVRDGDCDMVVRGEGERAMVHLAQGAPRESIRNLTWRAPDGQAQANPMEDDYVDLKSLPMPAYHKLPMDRYHSALGASKASPSIGLITSRGCPGKCTFCYSGMHGSRIRAHSAEKVVEHITFLMREHGIREVSFYDDTFTVNPKRVERICNLLLDGKVGIRWSCFARVDMVRLDLLKLMKRAGCHQISYGIESPDDNVLKAINKKADAGRAEQAMLWTRQAGIDVRGALMLGNPGETEETVQATIEYAKRAPIQFAMFNISTPFPGTELARWAEEHGYVSTRDWEKYDLAHAIMDLPGLPAEKMEAFYRTAYREFYLRPSYLLSRLLSIRSWHSLKEHVMAFVGIALTTITGGAGADG